MNDNHPYTPIFDPNETNQLVRQSSICDSVYYNNSYSNEKNDEIPQHFANSNYEENENNNITENQTDTCNNPNENFSQELFETNKEISISLFKDHNLINQETFNKLSAKEPTDSNFETIVKINFANTGLRYDLAKFGNENQYPNIALIRNTNIEIDSENYNLPNTFYVKEEKYISSNLENSDHHQKYTLDSSDKSENTTNPNAKRKQNRIRIQGRFEKPDRVLRILNIREEDFINNAQLQKIILENKDYQINAQINNQLRISHIELFLLRIYPNYGFPVPSINSRIYISSNLMRNEDKKKILIYITINKDKMNSVQVIPHNIAYQHKFFLQDFKNNIFKIQRNGFKLDLQFYIHIFHHRNCKV